MIIKEWLEAGKPKNEPFTIYRVLDIPDSIENIEAAFRTMAHLIIEAAKYHCDSQFRIELFDTVFFNDQVYRYEYEGYPFVALLSGNQFQVGARIVAL